MGKVSKKSPKDVDNSVFDMKRAKMEVVQLALKGLSSINKEKTMVDMLVQLGAKPPKNKCINYKELLKNKQKEKEEEKKNFQNLDKSDVQLMKKKIMRHDQNHNRKHNRNSGLKIREGLVKVPAVVLKKTNKNIKK